MAACYLSCFSESSLWFHGTILWSGLQGQSTRIGCLSSFLAGCLISCLLKWHSISFVPHNNAWCHCCWILLPFFLDTVAQKLCHNSTWTTLIANSPKMNRQQQKNLFSNTGRLPVKIPDQVLLLNCLSSKLKTEAIYTWSSLSKKYSEILPFMYAAPKIWNMTLFFQAFKGIAMWLFISYLWISCTGSSWLTTGCLTTIWSYNGLSKSYLKCLSNVSTQWCDGILGTWQLAHIYDQLYYGHVTTICVFLPFTIRFI